jgi:hypothetical protein
MGKYDKQIKLLRKLMVAMEGCCNSFDNEKHPNFFVRKDKLSNNYFESSNYAQFGLFYTPSYSHNSLERSVECSARRISILERMNAEEQISPEDFDFLTQLFDEDDSILSYGNVKSSEYNQPQKIST